VYEHGRISRFVHHGVESATAQAIGANPSGHGLLALSVTEAGPVLVADVAGDPRGVGFPDHHPPMSRFLVVRIQSAAHRHGNLYATDRVDGRPFDQTDAALLTTLAAFAACAIDNALLTAAEQAQAEARAQLVVSEQGNELRREALERAIEAQEAERTRVARDLHDDIGQSLTSMLIALHLAESTEPGSDEARHRLEELREMMTDTLDSVRRVAFELRPAVLDDIGLVAALHRLARDLGARSELNVDISVAGIDDSHRLPAPAETALYRIAQEALTNVARHAGVRDASVSLEREPGFTVLEVRDRGSGFEPLTRLHSLGLRGMHERASLIGGALTINSEPGVGTLIRIEVPE
jgi:signal transduction histidine kinase